MKSFLKFLVSSMFIFTTLISCKVITNNNNPGTTNDVYFNYSGFEFTFNQTSSTTYNYKTIDQDCKEITCSAYCEYETGNGATGTEFKLIIVDCHGTLMNNNSRPSNSGASFSISAVPSKRAIIISPDYIGYGITHGKTHPYVVADLNARNIIDSILSVKRKSGLKFADDCKTLIMGYSQGGQTSLATCKFIQNSIPVEYKNDLNVSKVYAGAGPYDLVATMNTFLSSDAVISPFVYLVIKGYLSMGYSSLKNYELEDFFTEEFLNSDMRASLDQMNYSLSNGGTELVTYSDINNLATPEFINSSSNISKAFKQALQQNNLTTGWTPEVPVYIYHLQDDDIVPFINFQKLEEGMNNCSNIEFYKSTETITTSGPFDFKHGKAAHAFYMKIINEINLLP